MSTYQDADGNYVETTEPCVFCRADVTITPDHRTHGDGPWCAQCSAVICEDCWTSAVYQCPLCNPASRRGVNS